MRELAGTGSARVVGDLLASHDPHPLDAPDSREADSHVHEGSFDCGARLGLHSGAGDRVSSDGGQRGWASCRGPEGQHGGPAAASKWVQHSRFDACSQQLEGRRTLTAP